MLLRLAAERATGALLRDRGTLYLADGQVVHAESPSSPGLEVLLTASGRLRPEGWREAVDRAGAKGLVGRFLIDSGQLAGGELELCHLSALHDAAFFVLGPSSGPTRFRYGVVHWMGPVHAVPTDRVEREAARRRELLDRLWPYDSVDSAPVVRADRGPASPVTPRQRSVMALADGTKTPQDIARALGRPAFHTLVDIRRLAAAGAVETPRAPAPVPSVPAWVADVGADQDVALLIRLRDALEAAL
ncbi:transcriptional regulator [Streptomyces beijiangensis]|nr:transcriptional regulator [Streptomyces beijiangensis]